MVNKTGKVHIIRAHAIQYSKRKAKERGKKKLDLQEELTKAKIKLENNTDHNKTYYNVVQGKLESFYEEKTKGIIIRARARWHEHGEKSTKYFFNLEKRNHVKKHIRKLQNYNALYTKRTRAFLQRIVQKQH